MVTLVSQNLSEFALHVRAVLGLPVPVIEQLGPSASAALVAEGSGTSMRFSGLAAALAEPGTDLRLFGKPSIDGHRRLGVVLARGDSLEAAREAAVAGRSRLSVSIEP